MEDWKKKYEETLRKAKEYYADVPGSREFLDNIFPELTESEDERIRKIIIKHFEEIANRDEQSWTNLDIPYILAYLEKQKEQKPAEWSEEDEAAFGDLMWCIEQARKSAKDENDMGNIWFAENLLKKLKSLRPKPHWRPSEEQMEALKYALDKGGVFNKEALEGLYEQLKKL